MVFTSQIAVTGRIDLARRLLEGKYGRVAGGVNDNKTGVHSTMNSQHIRPIITFSLVAAAVAFGMVLSGSLGLTSSGVTATQERPIAVPQTVEAPVTGLPGFADLAEVVSPAVVSIGATTIEEASDERMGAATRSSVLRPA